MTKSLQTIRQITIKDLIITTPAITTTIFHLPQHFRQLLTIDRRK